MKATSICADNLAMQHDAILSHAPRPAVLIPSRVKAILLDRLSPSRLKALEANLRDPDVIMTPDAVAAVKASSLSFSRTLVEQMVSERWAIQLSEIEIDSDGNGYLIYAITARATEFALIVRSRWDGVERPGRRMDKTADLIGSLLVGYPDKARIANELDAMGVPSWAGRTDARSFGFTAANRSRRLFDYVLDQITGGNQPDLHALANGGGYILRNAGYYGNGRAGAMSWAGIPPGHPFEAPYHLDLFLMYMWRQIGLDYIDAIAALRSAAAVKLSLAARNYIGVGNSSGLGMTCALVRWPQWVGTWCLMREIALAYVKTEAAPPELRRIDLLARKVSRAIDYYNEVAGPGHGLRSHAEIAADLSKLRAYMKAIDATNAEFRWIALCTWSERHLNLDAQEQLNALLMDLYPEITKPLADLIPSQMRRQRMLKPAMTISSLRTIIRERYAWALSIDRSQQSSSWHFWYHSQEAAEQRRGERYIDAGSEFETFVDVVGAVQSCAASLKGWADGQTVARFVFVNPQHAYIISRIQLMADEPYGEIRGNLVAKDFLPIKVIRFFLSNLGFESGSPRSIAWVRGVLLQGAPSPQELVEGRSVVWTMPTIIGTRHDE